MIEVMKSANNVQPPHENGRKDRDTPLQ